MKKVTVCAFVLCAALAFAQSRPQTVNGEVAERPSSGSLAAAIRDLARGGQASWVGYSVPVVDGEHHMCCFDKGSGFHGNPRCCGGCRLEGGNSGHFVGDRVDDCAKPNSGDFFVLARLARGEVEKIRATSADCGLDLGGRRLYWLGAVNPAESIAWLSGFAQGYAGEEHAAGRRADEALTAIAFHKDASADAILERFAGPERPRPLRVQASFWLASLRGRRGFDVVRRLFRDDSDPKFREEAVFALSEGTVPEVERELLDIARHDRDRDVRGEALMWLAEKAGSRAAGPLTDVIENDPDTEMKKKAVFALSEMENDQGVPLLIQVAKTNRNPVVRKEALFWLGQSNDSRALDYIESLLKR